MSAAPALDVQQLLRTDTFAPLSGGVMAAVLNRTTPVSVPAGDTLFRAGQAHRDALFIIYRGEMELQEPGGESSRVGPGAILGLPNYLDREPHASTARALDPVTALALSFDDTHQLEIECPAFARILDRAIARRIRSAHLAPGHQAGALNQSVRQVMRSPLVSVAGTTSLRDALALMEERGIGSLGVETGGGNLGGLVTLRHLAAAAVTRDLPPEAPVHRAAGEPVTVDADSSLATARERQSRAGVKYLVVTESDTPVGVLSQTDLLQALLTGARLPSSEIENAPDTAALAAARKRIGSYAEELWETSRDAGRAAARLSDIHLAIQRRAAALIVNELARDRGPAPVRFALFVTGSGGRREMLLYPDQDNGLIIGADTDADGADWFRHFSERFNATLDRIGYPLCPGGIMARTASWHQTLRQWREQMDRLVSYPNARAARRASILLDFDVLYGDEALVRELRHHVLARVAEDDRLLRFMQRDDAEGGPAIGMFNRLLTTDDERHRGKVDIKRNGLRIIRDATRIFSIGAGIAATNTRERLNALRRQGVLSAEQTDSLHAANEALMDLLLRHQLEQGRGGTAPDSFVDPDRLEPIARETLRMAMRAIRRVQDRLQHDYAL
jgi:CBS domain-containing protein